VRQEGLLAIIADFSGAMGATAQTEMGSIGAEHPEVPIVISADVTK